MDGDGALRKKMALLKIRGVIRGPIRRRDGQGGTEGTQGDQKRNSYDKRAQGSAHKQLPSFQWTCIYYTINGGGLYREA